MGRPEDRLTEVGLACTGESAGRSRERNRAERAAGNAPGATVLQREKNKVLVVALGNEVQAAKLSGKVMLDNKIFLFQPSADLEEGTPAITLKSHYLCPSQL